MCTEPSTNAKALCSDDQTATLDWKRAAEDKNCSWGFSKILIYIAADVAKSIGKIPVFRVWCKNYTNWKNVAFGQRQKNCFFCEKQHSWVSAMWRERHPVLTEVRSELAEIARNSSVRSTRIIFRTDFTIFLTFDSTANKDTLQIFQACTSSYFCRLSSSSRN